MKKAWIALFVVLLGLGIVQANNVYSAADRDPGPMIVADKTV